MRKLIFSLPAVLMLTSCSNLTTNEYEATALTSYTWQVKIPEDQSNGKSPNFATFGTTSLLNRNGLKPQAAVTGPDERGLWWPALPSRPSVDQIEQRQKVPKATKPELFKAVKYELTYEIGGQQKTLPTNYEVYREVVKAYPSKSPLELTLGLNDNSVEKAEIVGGQKN